jgi:hypothetical protein
VTAHFDVTIECDWQTDPECWTTDPVHLSPTGGTARAARADAKAAGWHRLDGRHDICPECWSRRVRHHPARSVTRD